MTDSIQVALAKLVVAAIEAERVRVGGGFEVNDFEIDYDWGGRAEEDLTENVVYARVVIPPSYTYAVLDDRDGSWAYGSTLAIELRCKVGVVYQESDDQEIERSRISALARTVEELHEFFAGTLTARRLTLTTHSKIAEWVDERDELKSAIEVVGSVMRLNQNRMFLGVLRESFEITDGT